MTAPEIDPRPEPSTRSLKATVLYVAAAIVVGLNSVFYFFGVESLSHPAVSALGLALLVPLYFREA